MTSPSNPQTTGWTTFANAAVTHNKMYMIVINNRIIPDVFVYKESEKRFTSNGVNFYQGEVQAVLRFADIPRPEWLKDEMDEIAQAGEITVQMAAAYRKKNGDLFGQVKDPDDDKIIDEQMDAL